MTPEQVSAHLAALGITKTKIAGLGPADQIAVMEAVRKLHEAGAESALVAVGTRIAEALEAKNAADERLAAYLAGSDAQLYSTIERIAPAA